jgi:hypothetical protein
MYAYSGVLTALYERERTGCGSSLELSLLDALGEWMSQPYYYYVCGGQDARRTGARHASVSPYGPYLGGKVFLTGLGLPSEMATYIESGVCPYMFLWNPIDVGYLGAYVATALVNGKITGKFRGSEEEAEARVREAFQLMRATEAQWRERRGWAPDHRETAAEAADLARALSSHRDDFASRLQLWADDQDFEALVEGRFAESLEDDLVALARHGQDGLVVEDRALLVADRGRGVRVREVRAGEIRGVPLEPQSDEYRDLEYYLSYVSNGLPISGPGARPSGPCWARSARWSGCAAPRTPTPPTASTISA